MKKTTAGLLAAVAAITFAGAAEAQTLPISLEIRGGLAFPTGDFADAAESGVTLGANATFQFNPMLGIYAGYSWNQFGINDEEAEEDVDADWVDSGFEGGVKISFAAPGLPVSPFIKGGAVYHKLELNLDGDGGDLGLESDNELGFELGGGVVIPLGPRLSVTPGITYTQYDLEGDKLSHVKVDVGLSFRL